MVTAFLLAESMVVKVGAEGTVFENSPTKTKADVRHELVPEISVAARILNQPETADKLREVSQKLKSEDWKTRGKVLTNRGWVNTSVLAPVDSGPDEQLPLSSDRAFFVEKYSGSPPRLRRAPEEPAEEPLLTPDSGGGSDWKTTLKKILCCCL